MMCGPTPTEREFGGDPENDGWHRGLALSLQEVGMLRETVGLLARDVESLTAAIERATRVAIAGSG